jgi:F-type H+-transporting ATPase subunit alpha
VENRFPEIYQGLKEKKEITSDIETKLKQALEAYDEEFKDTI